MLLFTLAFGLTLIICWLQEREPSGRFRRSWLKACLGQMVIVVIVTEALSLTRSLTPLSVLTCWTLIILVLGVGLELIRRRHPLPRLSLYRLPSFILSRTLREVKLWDMSRTDQIALAGVVLLLGLNGVTALIAPPNNFDAMTYHMPRVMHWLQNQSVAVYPTNNLRQISISPGASFLVAHFQLLSGGDRYANLVQCLAYLGTIVAASLWAEELLGRQARWLGGVVCATIPMAVLQATTAQTDLATAFWLMCFASLVWKRAISRGDVWWLAASFGLALLTKPTAVLFGAPFVGVLAWRWWRQQGFGRTIVNLMMFGMASLCLSIPTFQRNYQVFGNLLGPDFDTRSTELGMAPFLSTALKNFYLSLPLPGLRRLIDQMHRSILHLDINDPALNFPGSELFLKQSPLQLWAPHEDYVGSPVHTILISLAGLLLLWAIFSRPRWQFTTSVKSIGLLYLANLLSFVLFSSLLKWQEWGNRLMLPLVVLSSPLIVYSLWGAFSPRGRTIVVSFLVMMATAYSLTTLRHPLLPLPVAGIPSPGSILMAQRQDLYFDGSQNGRQLKRPYRTAVDRVLADPTCRSVGLAIGPNDWEYPLWVLLQQSKTPMRVQHVNVQNQTAQFKLEQAQPCAVISVVASYAPSDDLKLAYTATYHWFGRERQIWVYDRKL